MRHLAPSAAFAAAVLVSLAAAVPHGNDEHMDMDMGMDMHATATPTPSATAPAASEAPMSYFAYSKHTTAILAHIILMVLGWCFVLPIGKRKFAAMIPEELELIQCDSGDVEHCALAAGNSVAVFVHGGECVWVAAGHHL